MFFFRIGLLVGVSAFLLGGSLALGQATQAASVGFSHESSQPIEVTADSLRLDQDAGSAIFEGSVQVNQGSFHLEADHIEVFYGKQEDTGADDIERLVATGNIKLVSGSEMAEAQSAIYDVADGKLRMHGDILLTQGRNLIAGDTAVIDLNDGSARVEGRVRTVLQPNETTE